MRDRQLFQLALGINSPWFVAASDFDGDKRRLDIEIDFNKWLHRFGRCVRVSIPRADETTIQPERLLFEVLAPEYGLQPEDFRREFSSHGDRFRITGLIPRRPRFPVSAVRIPDGKGYKFTAEDVAALLQLSMKDVSPKS